MFDELFERPHALARQRGGPLADQRRRYLRHLADQGAARTSLKKAAHYILGICHYLALDERADERIGLDEIEENAALWARRPPPSLRRKSRCPARAHARFRWHATEWLAFLDRLHTPQALPSAHAKILQDFADFMRLEQGLSPATIKYRCLDVGVFLDRLGLADDGLRRKHPLIPSRRPEPIQVLASDQQPEVNHGEQARALERRPGQQCAGRV